MATGAPGTNGVWLYGEDDSEATFSALLNKAGATVNTQLGLDRTRLGNLELPGRVIQMVWNTRAVQLTTTSTSYISTGLSATITPRSASSRIIILLQSSLRTDQNGVSCYHTIYRGSVPSGVNISGGSTGRFFSALNGANIAPFSVNMVDAPGTTSATTYTAAFRGDNAAQTVYTNCDGALATLILLEVAA